MSTEADNTGNETTQTDKVNTSALGTLVTVSVFGMLAITCAVTALVRHDIQEEESEKAANANQVVIALKNQQRGVLNGPAGYVDRGKGLVSLPIETAKQLVVAELERDPNSATPAPPKAAADAGVAEAADAAAAGDASAAPATESDQKKPEPSGAGEGAEKGAGAKPATAKDHNAAPAKPAPAGTAPTSPPLTPTAASPGALEPGPLKH